MFKNKIARIILSIIILVTLIVILAFSIPVTREKILWHVDQWKIQIDYALNLLEESVFVPQTTADTVSIPTATATVQPSPSITPQNPQITDTPQILPSATPLPDAIVLDGII